ncbi:3-oxoacyl-[acyl-carrier protein] reductase [Chromohalobacter marismortui]|uniref:3-oxoacyl-[acyl-carrier protein] reductase n=1 Tax=Chromohalobacter marismortui TaxID=42055 RepID=A0A4R7NR24_9GAMM|nr:MULTISPECIES: SDR family oxidoreductase [Chromohalobacter]MCI0508491.1 SDR family oxidoreductase [Chromohalobacter sp.]MCI0592218.1 SDR family oxidoreductase [Chromohalobacter sp.]TDU22971.1 3-oxoacyl-[acyl-carrier protein] reductase [Chromohalobacter marismortui]
MQLEGTVVGITGGARGLGLAMAAELGARGARIALFDHQAEPLNEALASLKHCHVEVHAFLMDVTDEEAVAQAFAQQYASLGPLGVLVNNAGVTDDGLLVKGSAGRVEKRMTLRQWRQVIDVNLTGVFLCGREGATQMVEAQRGGVIINVSSISRAGNMGQGNYSASKAGVAALTVTWAKELARQGIRVAAVAPGFIETEMTASMRAEVLEKISKGIPLGHLGKPAHIAESVRYIVENDYFTGRVLECDGGLRI